MKRIPLHGKVGSGLFALVDDEWYARLLPFRWVVATKQSGIYAVTYIKRDDGKWRPIYMHQMVLPGGEHTDHRSSNTLDNRGRNLRQALTKQNIRNSQKWGSRLGRKTTSGFKGVFDGSCGRNLTKPWRAQITVDRRVAHLGCYRTQREAALAYDEAARAHFGEFARLNFPRSGEQSGLQVKV